MCFCRSGALGLFADSDGQGAIYEVTFWCTEFLVTERYDLIMVYTSSNSTVSPFYPFQFYVSSLFVLLRELPRSWWEALGGCSGWTLIGSFLLLLFFVAVRFQQGRQHWQGRRQRCHSVCCGAALPGNPGNWQFPPEGQLYSPINAGSPVLSLSTSPVQFCWGELLFPSPAASK